MFRDDDSFVNLFSDNGASLHEESRIASELAAVSTCMCVPGYDVDDKRKKEKKKKSKYGKGNISSLEGGRNGAMNDVHKISTTIYGPTFPLLLTPNSRNEVALIENQICCVSHHYYPCFILYAVVPLLSAARARLLRTGVVSMTESQVRIP